MLTLSSRVPKVIADISGELQKRQDMKNNLLYNQYKNKVGGSLC